MTRRRRFLTWTATFAALVLLLAVAITAGAAKGTSSAEPGVTSATPTPSTTADVTPTTPTTEQWRGYWVDSFNEGIFSPDEVSQVVADARAVGANALVVQVARWFDCFCDDAAYPRSDFVDPGYDPLEEVVDQAHAAGLEVHAWVNSTTLWSSSTPPTSPDHVYNTHGFSASGTDRWLNKRSDGTEQVGTMTYVDPANPAAVDYITTGVRSIVENYDVDGVNLDYIRYPDHSAGDYANDWGYSETSLARFAAETGRTDVPAPSDQQFSDWRRAQVTNLVRSVYDAMNDVDAGDRLSVNAVTNGDGPQTLGGWEATRPYRGVLQDWKGWLSEGIVDTVMTMNYKEESSADQARRFDEWNAASVEYRADRQVVAGPGLYLNDVAQSVAQAQRALASGVDGWNGYSYANATQAAADSGGDVGLQRSERAALTSALRSGVFAEDAAVPSMPWKASADQG